LTYRESNVDARYTGEERIESKGFRGANRALEGQPLSVWIVSAILLGDFGVGGFVFTDDVAEGRRFNTGGTEGRGTEGAEGRGIEVTE
jgi:hypothetical protein